MGQKECHHHEQLSSWLCHELTQVTDVFEECPLPSLQAKQVACLPPLIKTTMLDNADMIGKASYYKYTIPFTCSVSPLSISSTLPSGSFFSLLQHLCCTVHTGGAVHVSLKRTCTPPPPPRPPLQVRETKMAYEEVVSVMTEELNRWQKERSGDMHNLLMDFALTEVRRIDLTSAHMDGGLPTSSHVTSMPGPMSLPSSQETIKSMRFSCEVVDKSLMFSPPSSSHLCHLWWPSWSLASPHPPPPSLDM